MTMKTTIEMNPPNGGEGGWGLKEDNLHHKLMKERMQAEEMEDIGVFTVLGDAILAKGEETPMEKLVREKMPYDDGWDADYVDKLILKYVPYVNQNPIGSCVGAGASSGLASKINKEILIEGDPEEPFGLRVDASGRNTNMPDCAIPFVGYHYGCGKSRQRWTGEKFNGGGSCSDGSYCSVQIWALQTCGMLPCSEVKGFSKGPQSDDVRSWGCNRRNELNEHLEIGQKYKMGQSVRARSGDDLKEILTVLRDPLMICSGWGFGPSHHVEGLGWVYKRQSSWSHNMTLCGCCEWKGKWYVKVRNQWGSGAHKDGWHFWIELDLADTWMRNAEAQSFGELQLKRPDSLPSFPVFDQAT